MILTSLWYGVNASNQPTPVVQHHSIISIIQNKIMSTSIYYYYDYLPPLFLLLLAMALLVAPSQCLLTNPAMTTPTHRNSNLLSNRNYSPSFRTSLSFRNSQTKNNNNNNPNSNTALHLTFFDNFLHPYGVSPQNSTNNNNNNNHYDNYEDDDNNNNFFLSLLLPKYRSPEELKSQSLEEFQRARLEQQLRVMRNEKKKRQQQQWMKRMNYTNNDNTSNNIGIENTNN